MLGVLGPHRHYLTLDDTIFTGMEAGELWGGGGEGGTEGGILSSVVFITPLQTGPREILEGTGTLGVTGGF